MSDGVLGGDGLTFNPSIPETQSDILTWSMWVNVSDVSYHAHREDHRNQAEAQPEPEQRYRANAIEQNEKK